jgi:hypothetical protein
VTRPTPEVRVTIGAPPPIIREEGDPPHLLTTGDLLDCNDPTCNGACLADLPVNTGYPLLCLECRRPLLVYNFPHQGMILLGCAICQTNVGEIRVPPGALQ